MCIILPLEIWENLVFWEEACEIPCYSFHMHSQFCSVPVGSMYVNGGESCFYFHSFFFPLLLLIITGSFLVLYIEDSFWVALYVKRDRLCFGWHRNQLLFISNTQVISYLFSFTGHVFRIVSISSRKKGYIIFGTKIKYVSFIFFKLENFNCSNNEQSLFWSTPLISDPGLRL